MKAWLASFIQTPAFEDDDERRAAQLLRLVLAVCLDKALAKHVVRAAGVPTPDFVVVREPADAERVTLEGPLFAKPIAEGTSKGVTSASKIASKTELREVCSKLLAQFKQAVLVEEYLPGREFTVGIVGTGEDASVVAVMEVILLANAEAEVYTYINKEQCEERVKYTLAPPTSEIAKEASQLALAAWRGLGYR